MFEQIVLFTRCTGDYHTYRIPSLLVAANNDLLAFCEGRRDHCGDSGQIDLLMRRSADGSSTWSETQVVMTEAGMTCGNPCPVVERVSGDILLLFNKNLAEKGEPVIRKGEAPRTVWVARSRDHGRTWSEPRDITPAVKKTSWSWYATGPGHAVQLESGRLVVPCNHNVLVHGDHSDPYHSHTIYSDDGGQTWKLGGIVSLPTNEDCALELSDGSFYMNCRTRKDKSCRVGAISVDGGETFMEEWYDEALVEPGGCEGSLCRYEAKTALFCNPASAEERRRLTVRISTDDCRTWKGGRVLCEGPAAYSDLAVLPDQRIVCLYEGGEEDCYQSLILARFDMAWLKG